jgi:hypothetical protein
MGASTSVGATSGVAGTSSGVGGAAPSPGKCAAFDDEASWSMLIRFTNKTKRTIHLGPSSVTCSVEPLFQLADATGTVLPPLGWCDRSCWEVMTRGHGGCADDVCYASVTISLAPGQAFELPWDGLYGSPTTLLASCLRADPQASPECTRARHVLDGLYTFLAEAGSTVDCSQTIGTCGPCSPNAEGGCTTGAALIGGEIISAKLQVELDPGFGIGRSGSQGDWTPLPIELVFEE